jgi:hypothetical protein
VSVDSDREDEQERGGEHPEESDVATESNWRGHTLTFVLLVLLGLIVYSWIGPKARKPEPAVGAAVPQVHLDKSQAERDVLGQIDKAIILAREANVITTDDYIDGRVVVLPGFYALDFQAKRNLCTAISYSAKSRGGSADFTLRDGNTGRRVGSFFGGALHME